MSLDDFLDLNYDLTSEKWRQIEKTSPRRSMAILEGVARLIFLVFLSLFRKRAYPRSPKVLFLVGTLNQAKSIIPVARKTNDAFVVRYHTGSVGCRSVPEWKFYLLGLFRLPLFFKYYKECRSSYIRWVMRKRLDRFVLALSAIDVWFRYLQRVNPRVLVVANDHTVWPRSACKAAEMLGIRTVFIPHAPVGNGFPPLDFDYALLDGEFQAQKYPSGRAKVLTIGAVRYEEYVMYPAARCIDGNGVLICLNKIDSLARAEQMISRVKRWGLPVKVRPHPADRIRFMTIRKLAERYGAEYIDGRAPLSGAVEKVSYVVAGLSGVHMDAVMLGRIPITFTDWYSGDYYGLRQLGLLTIMHPDEMPTEVEEKDLSSSAGRLNAHLTHFDELPSDLAASFINKLAAV